MANIIEITDIITPPVCYGMKVTGTVGDLKCINYDKSNVGEYAETYSKLPNCDNVKEEDRDQYNEDGKLMGTNGTCKIYCKETATVNFPGNIVEPKKRGTYFAWPTNPLDENGLYRMKMQLSLKCTIKDSGKVNEMDATKEYGCPSGYTEYNSSTCVSKNSRVSTQCPSGFKKVGNSCITYHCSGEGDEYKFAKLSSDGTY
jgi:hypothetical protein